MKQRIILIISIIFSFFLFSCSPNDVVKLELNNKSILEYEVSNVDISKVLIDLVKRNKTRVTIPLTKDMVKIEDLDRLKNYGSQTITVSYGENSICITLSIIPDILRHKVTLKLFNEEKEVFVEDNKLLKQPEDPQIEGYTFLGWGTSSAPWDFSKPIKEDCIIYSRWEANLYNITYMDSDGNVLESSLVSCGSRIKKIDKGLEGKFFTGWDKEVPKYMPASNLVFVGTYVDLNTTSSEDFEYSITDEKVTITKYLKEEKKVVIPDFIDGKKVTTISSKCFDLSLIQSITIPFTIEDIAIDSFTNCIHLTEIIIDGMNPFYDSRNDCNGIVETEIDNLFIGCKSTTIPYSITQIGKSAFYNCKGLQTILIPYNVSTIGSNAFYGCSSLNSVNFNYKKLRLFDSAFESCTSLEDVLFKEEDDAEVIHFADSTFKGCNALKNIVLPQTCYHVYDSMFKDCSNLSSVEFLSEYVNVGKESFYNCKSLQYIDYEKIERLSEGCFYGCSSMKNFQLHKGIFSTYQWGYDYSTIASSAFENCSSLESIYIPNNISEVYSYAFRGCSNLKTVEFEKHNKIDSMSYYYSTCYLEGFVFMDCTSLISIKGLSNTDLEGPYIFSNCSSLTNIDFEEELATLNKSNIEKLYSSLFKGCSSLEEIIIPSTVLEIESEVFNDCINLKKVVIPSCVNIIDGPIFKNCTNATIYCEFEYVPKLWHESWMGNAKEIIMNYNGKKVKGVSCWIRLFD